MARVFIDGFESGKTDLWDLVVGACIATGIAGMDGTYCLSCDGFGDYYAHKYVPAARSITWRSATGELPPVMPAACVTS